MHILLSTGFIFDLGLHVAQADLELTVWLRIVLDTRSSHPCSLSAVMIGSIHYAQLKLNFRMFVSYLHVRLTMFQVVSGC